MDNYAEYISVKTNGWEMVRSVNPNVMSDYATLYNIMKQIMEKRSAGEDTESTMIIHNERKQTNKIQKRMQGIQLIFKCMCGRLSNCYNRLIFLNSWPYLMGPWSFCSSKKNHIDKIILTMFIWSILNKLFILRMQISHIRSSIREVTVTSYGKKCYFSHGPHCTS
jgi:hypothetical protein